MLCGRPLIAWAVQSALGSRYISRHIVSTDCDAIAGTASAWGAEAPFRRPAELATDTAAERLAWRHAIRTMEQQEQARYDVLVSVPATCPLRQSEDIRPLCRAVATSAGCGHCGDGDGGCSESIFQHDHDGCFRGSSNCGAAAGECGASQMLPMFTS
jgi:N-acylneuraminate cytidylyltransferase